MHTWKEKGRNSYREAELCLALVMLVTVLGGQSQMQREVLLKFSCMIMVVQLILEILSNISLSMKVLKL